MEEKQKRVIVLAEDSVSIREAVSFGLNEANFEVLQAENGEEALRYFDGRQVDFLLTDFHMPKMNGLELIQNIRGLDTYRFIPILVLTTETQKEIILQAKKAGGTGWLAKPFKMENLLQTIRRLIR